MTGLGARPVAIDPDAHDRLVALTSHLPHAIANVLMNQAGAGRVDGHDPLAAVGGSFRDMTRVAGANARIWVDIFLDNRDALLDGLREHTRRIDELTRALERDDAGFVARWVAEAAGNRRRLLQAAYPAVPEELYRVRVHVPDRPGVLSGITQALGAEGINIEDFELHHMSADVGRHGRGARGGRGAGAARGRAARRPGLRRGGDRGGRAMSAADETPLLAGRARSPASSTVPGDKSISHRAVMVASLCDGAVAVEGFGASADTMATVAAMRALGVEIERAGTTARCGSTASACAACGAPAERIDVAERRHADAAPAGGAGRPDRRVRARRRREHPPPADGPDRRPAGARWASPSRRTDGCPPVRMHVLGGGRRRSPTGCRWPRRR